MLITKNVEVEVNGTNRKYYENFGYQIQSGVGSKGRTITPRQKIFVSIEHLPKSSKCMVDIKCDACGKTFQKRYCDYIKGNKVVNFDVCDNSECKIRKRNLVKIEKYGTINNGEIAKIEGYNLGRKTRCTKEDLVKMAEEKIMKY